MPKLSTILTNQRAGAQDAHKIPQLDEGGRLDPSFLDLATQQRLANVGSAVDVGRYVQLGELLTRDNFEQALRTGIETLMDAYDDESYVVDAIRIPPGRWLVDADNGPIVLPGTYGSFGLNNQGRTISLIGSGTSNTVIEVTGSCTAGRGVFELGIEGGDFVYGFQMYGILIAHLSGEGVGSGIRFKEQALVCDFEDVEVTGFSATQDYEDGFGIAIDGADSGPHQHISMRNVRCHNNQIGAKFEGINQLHCDQLHLNQNLLMSGTVSGVIGSLQGGTMQDGENMASALGTRWFAGSLHPSFSTGWTNIVASGSGATCGVAAYATDADTGVANVGTCTITGLSGMTRDDVGRWLRLSGGSSLVNGIYQISEYVSATSVKVLKGTSHSSTGSLAWELRAHTTCQMSINGFPYHEGPKRCLIFIGPSNNNGHEVWSLDGLLAFNTVGVLVQGQPSSKVDIRNVFASGAPVARCQGLQDLTTTHDIPFSGSSDVLIDGFTRHHTERRGRLRRASMDLNQYITEIGSYCFDAQRSDTLTLATADVTEWRSVQNASIKFSPGHAGQYCTYDAADAGFGGPAITIVGGSAGATYKNLLCTIPNASLPSILSLPTLIVIGRLVNTTVDPSSARRVRLATSDGNRNNDIGIHDNGFFATGIYSVPWSAVAGMGNAANQPSDLVTATTNPFLIMSGGQYTDGYGTGGRITSYSMRASSSHNNTLVNYHRPAGTDITIHLPFEHVGTASFIVTWIGAILHDMSETEAKTLRGLAKMKFPALPSL